MKLFVPQLDVWCDPQQTTADQNSGLQKTGNNLPLAVADVRGFEHQTAPNL
jgi:hypothetical protein